MHQWEVAAATSRACAAFVDGHTQHVWWMRHRNGREDWIVTELIAFPTLT